jgi:WD40 repeat protein
VGEPDASFIASIAPNGKVRALQVINNLRSLKLIDIENGTEIASFSGHESELSGAQFSPDGNRLATSARDGTIKIWDAVTGQELLLIKPNAGKIESIAFSPNGKILAVACGDGTIRLFRSN